MDSAYIVGSGRKPLRLHALPSNEKTGKVVLFAGNVPLDDLDAEIEDSVGYYDAEDVEKFAVELIECAHEAKRRAFDARMAEVHRTVSR